MPVKKARTNVSRNWDYISLDLDGWPGQNKHAIGKAIFNWEKSHPKRRIVSMQLIYQPDDVNIQLGVVGISIYSETKR
jgi:hypothetical protein